MPDTPIHSPPAIGLLGISTTSGADGQAVAVEGVDLSVGAGEFLSLLGPRGCGKTTILRLIAGSTQPNSGRVLVDGVDVTGVAPNRTSVTMLFQPPLPSPGLSDYAKIASALLRRGTARGAIDEPVREVMEIVGLTGSPTHRMPMPMPPGWDELLVELARALVTRPRVLLLDNPLRGLYSRPGQVMQEELKRIQREVGVAFVYAAHDQREAMSVSDRVAVMNAGVIEQVGTPQEISEHPATPFVAWYVGAFNVLPGTAFASGFGMVGVDVEGYQMTVSGSGEPGHPVICTVQPADIAISSLRPEGDGLEATVIETVQLGRSTGYTARTGSGVDVAVLVQNVGSAPAVAPGDAVWLSWDDAFCYVISGDASGP